ncbi:TonB-dependent receptor domain-containing protein [Roseinatronobacter sp. NSM]|uniref:TonB-dependent receptor domain-containing protein n=1 Tax=Roseinatronobacter sp. NSM TaxID=3457785 RepID=UPI0040357CCA
MTPLPQTGHNRPKPCLAVFLCTSALAIACAHTAHAQQSGELHLGQLVLDPAFMRAQDPDGNAADRTNSHYVADAELDRARMGTLRDLFSGIASVSVGGGIPVAQKIFVNGVDMLNLGVTLDGVSQNNRIFHHTSANAFDPGLMKSVRVDAGAAAADAGPHAMAGAVVMETVDAADVLLAGRAVGGNARLSYASNGRTPSGSVTLAARHGGFEGLGYLKRAKGRDYRTGAGDTVAGSAADLTSGLLKVAYQTPDGHRFELSGLRMMDDALRPFRANMIGAGAPREPRRYNTTRDTFSLSYENTAADGFWDPRIVLGRSRVRVGVDQPLSPALGTSWGDSSTLSAKVENRFNLGELGTVTAGVDYYDRASTYHDNATARLRESARNTGAYAQARLDPTAALSLSFGLRFDHQDFTGVNGWHSSFSGFSGNLSAAYAVSDAFSLRAGVSSVFGGLSLEDNFIFNPAWDYSAMRAARSTSYTIGFDYEADQFRLDGEVFLTRIDNARVSVYARNAVGDAESRGFNLGLGYGWDGGYLRASYSQSKLKVDGQVSDSYSALDLGAPLGGVMALEAQHQPRNSDFAFGGSVQAAKAYQTVAAGSDRAIPGYAVANLFAEYHAPNIKGLVIRAEVNNLFDKLYADRATYGADFNSVTPFYEPGRSFSLTTALRF